MGRLIVVDGFYPNPSQVREETLRKGVFEHHSWRPQLCEWLEYFPEEPVSEELMLRLAEVIGANIRCEERLQGFYRLLTEAAWQRLSNGPVIVHIDEYDWVGVIGLTPKGAGNMRFLRHKETGKAEIAGNHEWTGSLLSDAGDLSRWDVVDEVALNFNRLVLFSPRAFHAPAPGFGNSIFDAKLTQQFQFYEEGADVAG